MRRYLCSLKIPDGDYFPMHGYWTFKLLEDAVDIRTLVVGHRMLCQSSRFSRSKISPSRLEELTKPLFKRIHKINAAKFEYRERSVLDIVQLDKEEFNDHPCLFCGNGMPDECLLFYLCRTTCKESGDHCDELQRKIRSAIAKAQGIEE